MRYYHYSLFCVCVCAMRTSVTYGYPFENCDYKIELNENEGMSVINPGGYLSLLGLIGYYGYFKPGSSCRYTVRTPPNYAVKIQCDIDIAVTGPYTTCATEQFRVSIDGSNDIVNRGMMYCGKGTITITSVNNFCAFGHTSTSYGGKYKCTILSMFNYANTNFPLRSN